MVSGLNISKKNLRNTTPKNIIKKIFLTIKLVYLLYYYLKKKIILNKITNIKKKKQFLNFEYFAIIQFKTRGLFLFILILFLFLKKFI